MTSLDPHNTVGSDDPDVSSWLGMIVALLTVLLALAALLLL
jgi:hypothetical protein